MVTPEIGLEFNVFHWFRISATGGYRFINGMNEVPGLTENELETWTGTLTFRIGGFGREHGRHHHMVMASGKNILTLIFFREKSASKTI